MDRREDEHPAIHPSLFVKRQSICYRKHLLKSQPISTTTRKAAKKSEVTQEAYMLARRAEPLSIRDDHQRRAKAGCVVAAVTRVTQQNLHKQNIS